MSGPFVYELIFRGNATSATAAAKEVMAATDALAAETQGAAAVTNQDTAATVQNANANWTIRREDAGAAIAVATGSQIILHPTLGTTQVPGTQTYLAHTAVIRLGRNGLRDTRPNRTAQTHQAIRDMIKALSPRCKRVVVVSPYNGRAKSYVDGADWEGVGTAAYTQMMTLIEEMQREFRALWLDMRTAAVRNAIYDLGLTPTSDDLADMALDCIPRQLFAASDNTHVNTTMQGWEGQFIGNYLRAIGY